LPQYLISSPPQFQTDIEPEDPLIYLQSRVMETLPQPDTSSDFALYFFKISFNIVTCVSNALLWLLGTERFSDHVFASTEL
jgi:hypothetical protein